MARGGLGMNPRQSPLVRRRDCALPFPVPFAGCCGHGVGSEEPSCFPLVKDGSMSSIGLKEDFLPVSHQPKTNFISFLTSTSFKTQLKNPLALNLQPCIFPRESWAPPPSPGLVGLVPALSSLPHSGALCLPSFLLPSQMTSTESAGLWSSHFLISTLYSSRGMDSRCSEKTYWASRCTFFWWTRWFQGPLPRSACSPPRLWVPFYGAVNSRWKHTSVNHGKRLCLGHRLDHWKNHGFQPINESEINVVLPFICSIVGLPEKDKINPWVHSENST